jgi:hypothetical protein
VPSRGLGYGCFASAIIMRSLLPPPSRRRFSFRLVEDSTRGGSRRCSNQKTVRKKVSFEERPLALSPKGSIWLLPLMCFY